MQWSHQEYALFSCLVADNLNDNGQCLDDKKTTHDQGNYLGLSENGQSCKGSTPGKRAGIAHKNACRIAVKPQKTNTSAGDRCGKNSKATLAIAESYRSHKNHDNHNAATSQAIKTVSQIDSVGETCHEQKDKEQVQPRNRKYVST